MIRNYVDEQGGSTEASVRHLLVSFEVDDDPAGREEIVARLAEEGIDVDRSLKGLDPDEQVVLATGRRPTAADAPPWEHPREATSQTTVTDSAARPPTDPERRKDGRGRRAAVAAVVLVLAAAAGAGGYLVGGSGGENLDASNGWRAAGDTGRRRPWRQARLRRGHQEGPQGRLQADLRQVLRSGVQKRVQGCGPGRAAGGQGPVKPRAFEASGASQEVAPLGGLTRSTP